MSSIFYELYDKGTEYPFELQNKTTKTSHGNPAYPT